MNNYQKDPPLFKSSNMRYGVIYFTLFYLQHSNAYKGKFPTRLSAIIEHRYSFIIRRIFLLEIAWKQEIHWDHEFNLLNYLRERKRRFVSCQISSNLIFPQPKMTALYWYLLVNLWTPSSLIGDVKIDGIIAPWKCNLLILVGRPGFQHIQGLTH